MRKLFQLLCVVGFSIIAASAHAHSYKQGDISIGHIWGQATAPGSTTAAVYVPLLNNGKDEDRLTGASSEIADKVEIDDTRKETGKTQALTSVVLEPGKPVSLRPGGIQLTIIGLKHPLKEGDTLPLTLQFEKAGSAHVDVRIESARASSDK